MTDERVHDPELEVALRSVPQPVARAEFKAQMRERFLAPADEALMPVERSHRRMFRFLVGGLVAVAATVILFVLLRPVKPAWRVLDGTTPGTVIVDGRRVDTSDTNALAKLLLSAAELETVDANLRVIVHDDIALELTPGTKLSHMRFAAAGPYTVQADAGSLRVLTGPAFTGRGMHVGTHDLDLQVTGTIFAIDFVMHGTCVCCIQGTLSCDPHDGGGAKPIEAEHNCFSNRDGSQVHWSDVYEPHAVPLRALKTWAEAQWAK